MITFKIGAGVPAGANSEVHRAYSTEIFDSLRVGISKKGGSRLDPVWAIGINLFACVCGKATLGAEATALT